MYNMFMLQWLIILDGHIIKDFLEIMKFQETCLFVGACIVMHVAGSSQQHHVVSLVVKGLIYWFNCVLLLVFNNVYILFVH